MESTAKRPAVDVGPQRARPGLALLLAVLSVPGSTIAWDLPAGGLWIGLPLAVAAIVLGSVHIANSRGRPARRWRSSRSSSRPWRSARCSSSWPLPRVRDRRTYKSIIPIVGLLVAAASLAGCGGLGDEQAAAT